MRRLTLMFIVLMAASFVQLSVPSVGASGQEQTKRPLPLKTRWALKRISGPEISPDGKWVLFSAVDVSLKDNKKTPPLWLVPLAGGESAMIFTRLLYRHWSTYNPVKRTHLLGKLVIW